LVFQISKDDLNMIKNKMLTLALLAVLSNALGGKSPAQEGAGGVRPEGAPASAVARVRVAAAQPKRRSIDWHIADPAEVLRRVDRSLSDLEALIHQAGRAQCAVLAFPEDTLGLLNWEAAHPDRLKDVLPAAVGRMCDRLGRTAASQGMYLVVCNDALEADGAVYNTAFLLGRDGKEIGRYHKVNLPIQEQSRARGDRFPVFSTRELGTVGMLICYDMVFPEATRCLALAGADVVFVPTLGGAAVTDDPELDRAAFRTRAVENFVYLVVAQRGGGSMIISPQGKVLAEAKGGDTLAIAAIDPRGGREGGDSANHQRDMRARLFRERSPAAFGLLVDPHPPVLAKVPEVTTPDQAIRVFAGILTVGEERFRDAAALARQGRTAEAIRAFEQLSRDYPSSWIDREARKRLVTPIGRNAR
jgi:predicted amidohydrolase